MTPRRAIVVYVMAARVIKEAGFRLKGDLSDVILWTKKPEGGTGLGIVVKKVILKGDMAILEGRQDEIWFAECGHLP